MLWPYNIGQLSMLWPYNTGQLSTVCYDLTIQVSSLCYDLTIQVTYWWPEVWVFFFYMLDILGYRCVEWQWTFHIFFFSVSWDANWLFGGFFYWKWEGRWFTILLNWHITCIFFHKYFISHRIKEWFCLYIDWSYTCSW